MIILKTKLPVEQTHWGEKKEKSHYRNNQVKHLFLGIDYIAK